jgi:mono/diheme cytochrome c family protein
MVPAVDVVSRTAGVPYVVNDRGSSSSSRLTAAVRGMSDWKVTETSVPDATQPSGWTLSPSAEMHYLALVATPDRASGDTVWAKRGDVIAKRAMRPATAGFMGAGIIALPRFWPRSKLARLHLFPARATVLRTSLVLFSIGLLSAPLYAQQPQLSATETAGRKIFQTRCAMCHVGQDPATELATDTGARRESTFGPVLSKTVAADEAKLREKIKNGGPRMPAYNLALTDDDISQVIAFIKTLDQRLTKLAAPRGGE